MSISRRGFLGGLVGVVVGFFIPVATPVSVWWPQPPKGGQLFIDTSRDRFYRYDGHSWAEWGQLYVEVGP